MSNSPLRAIMVSVDYTDILRVTLPYNRHHFDRVMIVTSHADGPNVLPVALENEAEVLCTDLFYEGGAVFNKWRALEWALDLYGREGWMCIMDADVLWPATMKVYNGDNGSLYFSTSMAGRLPRGYLATPLRRMWTSFPHNPLPIRTTDMILGGVRVPGESHWGYFPVHRNTAEWAGYTQIFHASDHHLGSPPWHETDWIHAGGADSFFQRKWPHDKKVRPPFEVLHLGPAGTNWMGRISTLSDGSEPEESKERLGRIQKMFRYRRITRGDPDPFEGEKLKGGVKGLPSPGDPYYPG